MTLEELIETYPEVETYFKNIKHWNNNYIVINSM